MIDIRVFNRPRKKLIVASHERSGTHFLMNTIGSCFEYVSSPWINLDSNPININYYEPEDIRNFFAQFKAHQLANIVKTHHSYDFFEKVLPSILDDFHIFYILRDPRDVMVSFWKFLSKLSWNEGPKTETCSDFIRARPGGHMMRYQYRQEESMLHRWRSHVDGWTLGVPDELRDRVTFLRFRDLNLNYEELVRGIGETIGETPISFARPPLHDNTILSEMGKVGRYKDFLTDADLQYIREVAGPTMDRLGYE